MTIRPKTRLLFPLLVLSMTLAMAASVHAQGGASATLQVTFGTTPHWTGVPGTKVKEIRQAERPGYDMFRYGGKYYAYNDNRWYMSGHDRGAFTAIDDHAVPSELARVPRDHWHNYPQGWADQNRNPRSGGKGKRH